MQIPKNKKKGFSLIEAIIYVAILGMMATLLIQFLLTIITTRGHHVSTTTLSADARQASRIIEHAVRTASSVNIGNSTFGSDPGVLELTTADPSTNPTIISLSADDGRLQMKKGAGEVQFITSDAVRVPHLVFYNRTGTSSYDNIQIEMTIKAQYGAGNDTPELSVTTSASMRK